ncbi:VWA domain-containing protein, partial [candidate division KSB1 bacterium]|nr:VWA domain-containing protein [candidate division KSB1 bacterium]
MYMKFGSTMRRFIFFFLVQLHLFSIAGQSAEHRSHAGFDLAIQQLKSEENAIRLDWYPPNIKFSKYELELINRADNSTRIMDVGMGTSFDLRNLHKGTKYEFKIRALDAEGQIIAESAVEKITLGEFFPIKSELLDYAPVQPSVKLTMNSLNSSNFPYIYSSVKLDMKGLENTRFDTTSFAAFEDGRLQKEYFHITLPDSFDGVRLVDFVLIIDNSSSMEDEHQDVLQNIDMFLDSLSSKAVNFRLGLVRFGQLQNWHEPILVNNGILTADPDTLKTWLGTMTADGGVEPGLRAITQAAIGMNFRPGSARHFLLITDEDSDAGDLQEAIDACNSRGIIVHAAVDPLSGNSYSDYCDPEFSIRVTGGLLFPVLGPYSQILNELQNYISNTFIIRYQTDNPVIDGVQREVIIRFTAHEYTSQDTGYYVPGAAPKIVRTPETKALSDSSLLAGSSVEIAAHITDYIAPYVSVATLNYRRLGESEYRSIALFNVYDSLYSANLPGEVVQSNAIEYYITASDGYIISSDPAFDPADHPYQIAIFPNFPPA